MSFVDEGGDVFFLAFGQQCHDDAGSARATGAAGAMRVVLDIDGWIDVYDEGDTVDVDASCNDVRSHQYRYRSVGERRHGVHAAGLGFVSV